MKFIAPNGSTLEGDHDVTGSLSAKEVTSPLATIQALLAATASIGSISVSSGDSASDIDIGGGEIKIGGESILKSPTITINLLGDIVGSGNTTLESLSNGVINITTSSNVGTGIVSSFNTRTGDVSLTSLDITTALGANLVLNSNTSLFSNNATFLNGQSAAYYINANNLTGTVPVSRLGEGGTSNSTTVLYGNNIWGTLPIINIANTTVTGTVTILDSVSNTSIATYVPSANSVKRSYDAAIVANTNAATALTAALTANTNAANASFLANGTVPTARLGSGVANSTTILYGNNTWGSPTTVNIANTTITGTVTILDSVSNTSITTYAPSANSVKTAYDAAIVANTNAANASFLANGTVPTARLGSGVANSTTILYGNNVWDTIPTISIANTTTTGTVTILDSVSNTAVSIYAASPNSVKIAYDTAIVANTNAANASFLANGTVPTARLGSGTANSSTVLAGNNAWISIPTPTISSQVEAEAGVDDTKMMTPLSTKQAITYQTVSKYNIMKIAIMLGGL